METEPVVLIQNETTAGLVCRSETVLGQVKPRQGKHFLATVPTLAQLREEVRVPDRWKKWVRRGKKTTFIYSKNSAVRVIFSGSYHDFLIQFGKCFATSANAPGETFDREWGWQKADWIVEREEGIREGKPSKVVRLGKKAVRRLR